MNTNRIILPLLGMLSLGAWNIKAEAYESLTLELKIKTNKQVDTNSCRNILQGMHDDLIAIQSISVANDNPTYQCNYNIQIRQIKALKYAEWHRRTFQIQDPSTGTRNNFIIDIKCHDSHPGDVPFIYTGGDYCYVNQNPAYRDAGCSWTNQPSSAQFKCLVVNGSFISMDVTLPEEYPDGDVPPPPPPEDLSVILKGLTTNI